MLSNKNAYEELKRQYHHVLAKFDKSKYMPIKDVSVAGEINGVATITDTHMEGVTLNGLKAQKHIICLGIGLNSSILRKMAELKD